MLLTTPSAVDFLVYTGEGDFGKPISYIVCRRGIISLAATKSAPNSASAADVMTNLINCAIVRTGQIKI